MPRLKPLSALALVAYGLLIGWLSLTPSTGPAWAWDKLLHAGAYFLFLGLGAPLVIAAPRSRLVGLALGIFAYSAALEVAQHFLSQRYMSGLDLLANAVGLVLAGSLLWLWRSSDRVPAQEY